MTLLALLGTTYAGQPGAHPAAARKITLTHRGDGILEIQGPAADVERFQKQVLSHFDAPHAQDFGVRVIDVQHIPLDEVDKLLANLLLRRQNTQARARRN